MIESKLKKIEGIDEEWLSPPRISEDTQGRADQFSDNGTPGLFTNLVRVSVAGIAGLRFSGKVG